ncbi:MAG: hypothetical protein AAGA96_09725 [Verrucomicrobiota bacterium]
MKLPYQDATSGQNAINEIQKVLKAFGCTKFATGEDFDSGELFVQFQYHGRLVHLVADSKGYAAAWLKNNPWSSRRRCTQADHERRALQIGSVAVYSVLRDWVKGQITAVEIGMMSFEGAFLSHMQLSNGKTVMDHVNEEKLLPATREEES